MPPEISDQATTISARPKATTQAKKPRVLACTSCQQRKVRCDRNSPCGNCIKFGQPCIPASTAPRKRRFPERALLDRLRQYESLLQENGIRFDPLHSTQTMVDGGGLLDRTDGGDTSDEDVERSTSSAGEFWPKDMWKAVYGKTSDEFRYDESDSSITTTEQQQIENIVKQAWHTLFNNNDHLILGLRESVVNLAHLHPGPIHVLRLWQIYLDNVDPLLKVTHNSALQARIIEAVSKLTDLGNVIEPPLEALMFSIYCTAVSSLEDEDCRELFDKPRKELLRKYHLACQEALLNAGYMRTGDRDCLTAFFFYLLSAGQNVDPRALCSMLGAAIRVGQRMRLYSEAVNAKYPPHEAEMRRRLWWSLVLFEARISEMADVKISSLAPTWDCKIPLNVAGSELRSDLQEAPREERSYATEAIFPVVRSAIADHIRHTNFFLDMTCPALKPLVKDRTRSSRPSPSPSTQSQARSQSQNQGGKSENESELTILEKQIEEKYLQLCDAGNPLQYTTIWTARAFIAKYRQIEYFMTHADSPRSQTESQRATATAYALRILECDNMIMNANPKHLTRGFKWFQRFYFPLPTYLYLAQELKRCPIQDMADRAWEFMSVNHAARFGRTTTMNNNGDDDDNANNAGGNGDSDEGTKWSIVVSFFASTVIDAWGAREDAVERMGGAPLPVPGIVTELKGALDAITAATTTQSGNAISGVAKQGTSATAATAPGPVPSTMVNMPMNDMFMMQTQPGFGYGSGHPGLGAAQELLITNPWSAGGVGNVHANANAPALSPFGSLWGSMAWEMSGYGAW